METKSFWTVYTKTDKKPNAQKIIKLFLEENPYLNVDGDISFEYYEKTNVIRANLKCIHSEKTWAMIAFDIIHSANSLSYGMYILGCLSEEVELVMNKIKGANGGISDIFVSAMNPEINFTQ